MKKNFLRASNIWNCLFKGQAGIQVFFKSQFDTFLEKHTKKVMYIIWPDIFLPFPCFVLTVLFDKFVRFPQLLLEWFLVECRETKTKVITLANHKEQTQYSEPIKTRSNYR